MNELKAVWITDYDHRTDKLYKRPGCPDCEEAIGRFRNVYKCYNCGAAVEVEDEEMKAWLVLHEDFSLTLLFGSRDEDNILFRGELDELARICPKFKVMGRTIGCGRKKCVRVLYTRNPVTLEWQLAQKKCTKCGYQVLV